MSVSVLLVRGFTPYKTHVGMASNNFLSSFFL